MAATFKGDDLAGSCTQRGATPPGALPVAQSGA